jgi:hypothetical protein
MIAPDLIVSPAVSRTNVDAFIFRGVGLGPECQTDKATGVRWRVGLVP